MTSRAEAIRLYRPPTECGDGRCTCFTDFIYCVAIPLTVVLVILIILSRIMCCKSCGCRRDKPQTNNADDFQMDTYNSIRRASNAVRQMSHDRETALIGNRPGSMTLDRSYRRAQHSRYACNSAPGTLQRQHRNRQGDRDSMMRQGDRDSMRQGDRDSMRQGDRDSMAESQHYLTPVEAHGTWRARQNRYSEEPAPPPPPPPPYSLHTDDDSEFLVAEDWSKRRSVRYEDSPENNGSGSYSGQPLLPSAPYAR